MTKLLSINNYNYARGGAEVVFLEHNRLFENLGWDVLSFCMQHPNNLPSDWDRYFVDEIEFGNDYSLLEKLKLAPKTIYSFEAKRKMRQLLLEQRPDIAHAHNIYHHISPSILKTLRDHNIPTVLTLHDLKIACPAYKMLSDNRVCEKCKGGSYEQVLKNRCLKGSLALSAVAWLEARIHAFLATYKECVTQFVVPSRFYIEKFVEWGWPEESFSYVPNFVDSATLKPEFTPGEYILYFGRLSEEKGLHTLVNAVAATASKLVVVGTGPSEAEIKALVEQKQANVVFTGYQSGKKLHELIAGSRAVVLPSEWYENAPISVMEAYALGKPVIGADIGGIPELIEHNHSGLIFTSGSVEALAESINSIESFSDEQISSMGKFGRTWVENEFTAEKYVDNVRGVYNAIDVQ